MSMYEQEQDKAVASALRELPQLEPSSELLAGIDQLVAQTEQLSISASATPMRWTIAATALLSMCVGLLVWDWPDTPASDPPSVADVKQTETEVSDEFADLSKLIAQSALLDKVNATLPERRRVRDVRSAGQIVMLEDRVAMLDVALASPAVDQAQREALLRRRVGLMDTLVDLRSGRQTQQWL
ncbi:MAG: hypothetical protein AAFR91_06015 [Pseudomonadota bacterium]